MEAVACECCRERLGLRGRLRGREERDEGSERWNVEFERE